jgi:hypothetical protein
VLALFYNDFTMEKKRYTLILAGLLVLLTSFSNLIAFEVDTEVYKYYFYDKDIRLHMDGLRLIEMNVDALKGNEEIIDILVNELESYGPGKIVFDTASPEDYEMLFLLCLSILADVSRPDDVKRLKSLFENETNLSLIAQYITTMGKIGDNEKYETSRLMVRYFNSFDLASVSSNYEFAVTSIDSFSNLSKDKPVALMETIGLVSLFKLFVNKEVFTEKIVDYAKRKLVSTLRDNM